MADPIHHLHVHGLVQGVGYRWSLVREASRLGLRGWVRNRRDGSVEAVAAGPAAVLQQLVAWAHRGPPAAAVLRVEVRPAGEDELAGVQGFEQRPTA
jgi:acylphosphatase